MSIPSIFYLRFFSFLIMLSCSIHSFAQSKVRFVAESSSRNVSVGSPFRVSFRLENAEIKNISFPDFEQDGFEVLQGPMSESSYMITNGQRFFMTSYSYVLKATRTGRLRLSPAKVKTLTGKELYTKPISITAQKGAAGSAQGSSNLPASLTGKVLFKMIPDKTSAVVGEQVFLKFKVYTKIDIQDMTLINEPDLDGIFTHTPRYYDAPTQVENINGQMYASKVVHVMSFYPSKNGTIEIEPATIRIRIGRSSRTNPYASGRSYEISTAPLTIEVKSLSGQHPDFSGGVGEYSMKAQLEKERISSDDMIKITMEVEGFGDVKQIVTPKLKFDDPKAFESYPPDNEQRIKDVNGQLAGLKRFHYLLGPQKLGTYTVRPSFTYYDIYERKMITLDTTLTIQVTQGKKKLMTDEEIDAAVAAEDSVVVEKIAFRAPQTAAYWSAPSTPFFGTWLFWLITLLPVGSFWFIIFAKRIKQQQDKRRAEALERTRAEREAKENLEKAQEQLNKGQSQDFYQTIASTLKGYLGLKLDIPAVNLNLEVLEERLEKIQYNQQAVHQLQNILKICEESVFAAQDYADQQLMQRTYKDTADLIKNFNKNLS